jgi:hypothetical protein
MSMGMFSKATALVRPLHETMSVEAHLERTRRNTMFGEEYGILTGEHTGEDVARQGHNWQCVLCRTAGAQLFGKE